MGLRLLSLGCWVALGVFAAAQVEPPPSREVAIRVDSGFVSATGKGSQVVFETVVRVRDAQWLRLQFAYVTLSGDPSSDNASFLRITSLRDGAQQRLNLYQVYEWAKTSAYFNGDRVRIEIVAFPGTGPNRLKMTTVTAGEIPVEPESICDGNDDRILSNDPRVARLMSVGCTAWMINDLNRQFITAGHCGPSSGNVVQFNVPLSNSNGSVNHPPPEDQYAVDAASIQRTSGGVGNDWAYFGVFPNSNTFLQPYQVQGSTLILASSAPPPSGQLIRITGYGTTSLPVPPQWNQVQKTHAGSYFSMSGTTVRYRADTTGGNSGSPVIDESSGLAIGVHTHGGCTNTGGSNAGTAIHHAGWQNALANPLRGCRSGLALVSPPVYAAGDIVNNFGTVSTTSGAFGKVLQIGAGIQGLAYNPLIGRFYAVDTTRRLFTIDALSATFTDLGVVSGTTAINGLAFDPGTQTVYGIRQSDGQLYRIDVPSATAIPIGSPGGGTIGGLDFDPVNNVLYGIDKAGGARLVEINTANGSRTVVGSLGLGAAECNGLAFNPVDGQLYTVNGTNQNAYRIDRNTGAATLIGPTGGIFGTGFGLAASGPLLLGVVPTTFTVMTGVHFGGGLPELRYSDDQYLRVREAPPLALGLPSVQVRFASSLPSFALTELRLRVEASVSAVPANGVLQRVEMFNYVFNTWEIVAQRAATSSDVVVEVVPSGDPNRFVQTVTGKVEARVSFFDPGTLFAFGWHTSVDQVIWIARG